MKKTQQRQFPGRYAAWLLLPEMVAMLNIVVITLGIQYIVES